MVGGEERGARGRDSPRHDGEPESPHRPVGGEREADQQEVSDQVEQCEKIHLLQQQAVQEDDREVRQVLVVEEPGKAEVQRGPPVVERVLTAGKRLAGPLDQQEVKRVVVQAGDRDQQLGEEGLRGEGARDDDQDQEDRRPPPARGIARDQAVSRCQGGPSVWPSQLTRNTKIE